MNDAVTEEPACWCRHPLCLACRLRSLPTASAREAADDEVRQAMRDWIAGRRAEEVGR